MNHASDPSMSRKPEASTREVDTEVQFPDLKTYQRDIEQVSKSELSSVSLSWKGYQATLEVAGRFAGSSMSLATLVAGEVSEDSRQQGMERRASLLANFQSGLNIMQEVADDCFGKRWEAGRGHDEEAAKIRAAAEIALACSEAGFSLPELRSVAKRVSRNPFEGWGRNEKHSMQTRDPGGSGDRGGDSQSLLANELADRIKAQYAIVEERLRVKGVAEEFWGGLVAAAQLGAKQTVLLKRTNFSPGSEGD